MLIGENGAVVRGNDMEMLCARKCYVLGNAMCLEKLIGKATWREATGSEVSFDRC